ncbi:ABC transporter ATP-binding protein [Terribacillus halophilus]|uniref:ABC transporter ATP-binding protein n=1 Tax=Terribacillus halophilus TaxID=361279 RepID=UPI0009849CF7|nr:ABC transporter ATP-binding protein [Terribacillus halophilus]
MTVRVQSLGRCFGEKQVLQGVDFSVGQGEIVSLLGTSGCGKSTVLRALAGLDKEYEGSITIELGQRIGFIFQEPRLLPWKTVLANTTFGLKGDKRLNEEKARRYLELVGLKEAEKLYPRELSGGMAQRVAIARALVTEPDILLLDEPFSALDAFTKMQLQELLLKIWGEIRTTIVLVTHDIDEALYLSDRVLLLQGKPSTLAKDLKIALSRPRSRGSASLGKWKEDLLNLLEGKDTAYDYSLVTEVGQKA